MYWEHKALMKWVELAPNPFYPPRKRRRVDYAYGPDDAPLDYDAEFAVVVDASVGVEREQDPKTMELQEVQVSLKKWWVKREIHYDIMGTVYLNVVECGKYLVDKMEYSHAKRVVIPVDDLAQMEHPMVVPSSLWYPNFLRPRDRMRPGYKLVADRSRILMDLTGVPLEDRELYNDFAHTSVVQAVRRLEKEADLLYSVAIRTDDEDIFY